MGTIVGLEFGEARAIADKVVEALEAHGEKANVAVVDPAGHPLVLYRMPGTPPVTMHLAILKAQQAAHVGRSTRWIRDAVEAGERTPELLAIDAAELVPFAGGVPIFTYTQADRSDVQCVGGVGVSALSEADDEACATAGVELAGFMVSKG